MECQRTWYAAALIGTAGSEGVSGPRTGCFGGMMAGDTGLDWRATGLMATKASHKRQRCGSGRGEGRGEGRERRAEGAEKTMGMPRGTGLGAGATGATITTSLGGRELPELRAKT
ncbi:hypothetical protein P171DRAFT_485692 [Karstenula rhodostoma CBS 690.94]|uniref:Uncharacterized protein n=1 Tax=Karstenula rhodostoma CBS 690.94 TaxID=1392251 RepID=A0A9P4UBK6_9PLEO|nr:hypothetical protein P171DRAFT_485692 [Karstenula rhodostoma CBS 690.94]